MTLASEALSGNLKEKNIPICKWAPSGICDGVDWDDGAHQKIEKIIIGYDEVGIKCIQAVYSDSDNIEMLGPRHGSNDATSFKMINITKPVTRIDVNYDDEGHFGRRSGITSLEFSSSEGSYGSIGRMKSGYGDSFTFESDLGFAGFHGHVDDKILRSLGVYINTSAKKYLCPSSN